MFNARKLSLLALAGLMTFDLTAPSVEADDHSTFQREQVFDLEYASDPRISPDGKTIVYVRRSNDVMTDRARGNLWTVNTDGSRHRPLLSGTASYASPRWSPDGTRLAYVTSAEGRGAQIYIRWMDTGDTVRVSELQRGPRSLTWSPDGQTLAFVMDVADSTKGMVSPPKKPKGAKWAPKAKVIEATIYRFNGRGFIEPATSQIFTIPAEGGTPRQLTTGRHNLSGPLSFSADGNSILFASNFKDDWEFDWVESNLFSVDLKTQAVTAITDRKGVERRPTLSPDGKRMAWLQADIQNNPYRTSRIVVADGDGANPRIITGELDRSIASLNWSGNKTLFASYVDEGHMQLSAFDLNGRERKIIRDMAGTTLGRPYVSGSYTVSNKGVVAYTRGTAHRPADLAVTGTRRDTQTLTDLNSDVLGHITLGDVREITYASSFDGTEIQGWYVLPPDYEDGKAYPVILELHGGPHAAYGPHFSAEVQLMAANGYVVFYPNYRGSVGYGEEFALKLKYKYSSKEDFADNVSGLDALIEQGIVDKNAQYITGGSAGGIASAYAIGLTDRFNAAAVAKPVINWVSKILVGDIYTYQVKYQFPAPPWEDPDHYWKRSPISLVGNITTPTILLTGEEDWRTPMAETEQFYQALKLKGVDTAMVRFPGSPHGIAGRPSRLIAKVDHILAWFKKYPPAAAAD